MTTVSASMSTDPTSNTRGRVIVASLVGTTIEFYDFYVYATAAVLVFPTVFFPSKNPIAAELSSFATFALAFAARPIGSLVFGHFGDRIGRKTTLVASLLSMGVATFLIGFLPSFSAVGLLAPVLLALLRFVQGIGLGGEWSGAALLATENAPPRHRGLFGMFPQLGAPLGFIAANGVLLVLSLGLSKETFISWGWRVPFLLSGVLVIVGLYVRLRLAETTAFRRATETGARVRAPIRVVFARSWRSLLIGTFALMATYVTFYFMTTFALTYGTAPSSLADAVVGARASGTPFDGASFKEGLGFARADFLVMLIVGVLFFGALTPLSGWLADRWGRRRLLIGVTVAIGLFGLTFQPWLAAGADRPISTTVFLAVGLALMGLTWGPLGALLPEMFPTNVRYTGSALAYNVASVLGASVAPIIALLLWRPDGDITTVGLYLSGAAVVTLVALVLMPETREIDLVRESTACALDAEADQSVAERADPGEARGLVAVSGQVRDTYGATVPGARLTLLSEGGAQLATTAAEADGTYRFADVRPGRIRLVCRAPQRRPAHLILRLGAGAHERTVVLENER